MQRTSCSVTRSRICSTGRFLKLMHEYINVHLPVKDWQLESAPFP